MRLFKYSLCFVSFAPELLPITVDKCSVLTAYTWAHNPIRVACVGANWHLCVVCLITGKRLRALFATHRSASVCVSCCKVIFISIVAATGDDDEDDDAMECCVIFWITIRQFTDNTTIECEMSLARIRAFFLSILLSHSRYNLLWVLWSHCHSLAVNLMVLPEIELDFSTFQYEECRRHFHLSSFRPVLNWITFELECGGSLENSMVADVDSSTDELMVSLTDSQGVVYVLMKRRH